MSAAIMRFERARPQVDCVHHTMSRVASLVRDLGLLPHPEGGFYREVVRSALGVQSQAHEGERAALTHIDFLLEAGTFSAWHVVTSDELWHHYLGDPLELHLLEGEGEAANHRVIVLGHDLEKGEVLHAMVPAGVYQAAATRGAYSLMGCTVAPGFEFRDFSMPARHELAGRFGRHTEILQRFTR